MTAQQRQLNPEALVAAWLGLPPNARAAFAAQAAEQSDEAYARALKHLADRALRQAIGEAQAIAALILAVGEQASQPVVRAIGLLAQANCLAIGLGEYRAALACYDEAAAIYAAANRPADAAGAQVGKVWALACLGAVEQAEAIGAEAATTLAAHERWQPLATLKLNLAAIAGRGGRDAAALAQLDAAAEVSQRLGASGAALLPLIEQNRAIVLRNLGCFELAIAASETAEQALMEQQQPIEAARAQQNRAFTYFLLGRIGEALHLLDTARTTFAADQREHDALLVDLAIAECLIALRRFSEARQLCHTAEPRFVARGAMIEAGQALIGAARAEVGLGNFGHAHAALARAEALFAAHDQQPLADAARLARAEILLAQGDPTAYMLACACATAFSQLGLPLREAEAQLLAARAAPDATLAHQHAHEARQIALSADAPALLPQVEQLLARLAHAAGDLPAAQAALARAATQVEALCGRTMVEHRATFLSDKQQIYNEMIALCLAQAEPEMALEYAERARSRSLRDLLTSRLDLRLAARDPADQPLVERLRFLQAERDRLLRRWAGWQAEREQHSPDPSAEASARAELSAYESEITANWHRLLLHNAAYAREADLWQITFRPFRHMLAASEVLVEYFVADEQIYAFVIDREAVRCLPLAASRSEVARLERLWRMNGRAVGAATARQRGQLEASARQLAQRLYSALFAPLGLDLKAWQRLTIVPHGLLHYLPFHALHDGQAYLIEQIAVRYLPSSSLLGNSPPPRQAGRGALVLGHSAGGQLPFAPDEAAQVAALLATEPACEGAATLGRVRAAAASSAIIHLAAHGDFRPDNPLFSGVALEDGWLTTLAIFDLPLQAGLVTLSACATGQSVLGGGDELHGLMRALLFAGAASAVVSLWPVADASTASLMVRFYRELVAGTDPAEALRISQIALLRASDQPTAHPYFWAPFILVGAVEPIFAPLSDQREPT